MKARLNAGIESAVPADLITQIRACTLCVDELPNDPKPIFVFNPSASLNIIGQAPGKLAHDSGIAWNDPSGERLRTWLGICSDTFYAATNILPMSFCFPGYKNNADAPPLKRCAPTWHRQFLDASTATLTVYIGRYAQQHYLPEYKNLTDAVADWQTLLPSQRIVLPHPSGRNNRWLTKHLWFERDVLPKLRKCTTDAIKQHYC